MTYIAQDRLDKTAVVGDNEDLVVINGDSDLVLESYVHQVEHDI
jgi:hypothetical protein